MLGRSGSWRSLEVAADGRNEDDGESVGEPGQKLEGAEASVGRGESRERKMRAGGGLHRAPDVEVLAADFLPARRKKKTRGAGASPGSY